MTEKSHSPEEDNDNFAEQMRGVKPLKQDTVVLSSKKVKKDKLVLEQKNASREANFYFSDQYAPHFSDPNSISYVQPGHAKDLAKQLRKGHYYPDLILDLHGLTQQQAKIEIAALIKEAIKQQVECVCIVHGLGSGVLKQKTPAWLVQHPSVLAIHQASLEWGGKGALLVLIDLS
ncbi:Smr protein/MutS2 [Catenovulum agarivorans DS-2]|uniref:Ribosome rescue factor SmrB n=1 Tax=Catenovulum agarivorans DS-2 TaxID=1328313 RepID=W7QLS1_9ALTE|nr:endonuclease SmrB [Catenovulum agarivorans]EWH09887.1 Smr protein/MutS2 [Catenovulum agarivorans DS-2]